MTDRPDVDTLLETVAKYRPVSSGQKHANEFDAALTDLAARARAANWRFVPDGEVLDPYDAACMRADEAERRVTELEARVRDYEDDRRTVMTEECDGSDDRRHCSCVPPLRERVTELEAALRENVGDAYSLLTQGESPTQRRQPAAKRIYDRSKSALAGDGGSARPDGPARRPPPPPPVDIEPQTEFTAGDDWRWPGDGGGA